VPINGIGALSLPIYRWYLAVESRHHHRPRGVGSSLAAGHSLALIDDSNSAATGTAVDPAVSVDLHMNHTHTQTHTHPFNGPLSATTRMSRYQKGKTNLDFTEARDSEWQWYQLSHMQVCISLQTDNHTSTPPLCFYRPDALPAAQPTASKH